MIQYIFKFLEIDKLLEDAPADLKEKYVRQRSESNSHASMQRYYSQKVSLNFTIILY